MGAKQKKSDNRKFPDDFLQVNMKTLRLAGLWNCFGTDRGPSGTYWGFSCTVSLIILTHILTQMADVYFTWGDLMIFSANASTILTYGAALFKQVGFLATSGRIYAMVYGLRDGRLYPGSKWTPQQHEIARQCDRHVRIMSWSYYGLGIGCLGSFLLGGIVSYAQQQLQQFPPNSTEIQLKRLPYRAEFPFDVQQNGNFEIAFIFQMIVIFFGPTVNIGFDTLFVGLVIHACGQFQILKASLKGITDRAANLLQHEISHKPQTGLGGSTDLTDILLDYYGNDEDKGNRFRNALYDCLNDCIQHHQNILNFTRELEDVFHPMMFAQFLSSSGTLCLIIFQITVINDGGIGLLIYLQFLAISIMQLLLFCWYATQLTSQSESVLRAVYETPWYECAHAYQRNCLIMATRAVKPINLSGGKIYYMSLDTFLGILKASFSYYTVLKELNKT